jgi:hypothetical protein
MSTAMIIVAVVAAVIVTGVLTICTLALIRRRELQHRFGTEYDRVTGESGSTLRAEAGLKERERRVRGLDIRPLTNSARESYADQWAAVQEQFVDAPADAAAASQVLVIAVMNERGYPADHPDQVLDDLSVEHASTLDGYRSAEKISASAAAGMASTEDLRLAVIGYRALFRDLLGEPDTPPAAARVTMPVIDPASGGGMARPGGRAGSTRPAAAGEPADGPSYAPQRVG